MADSFTDEDAPQLPTQQGGWIVTRQRDGEVHVHPNHDLIVHSLQFDCPCIPTPEYVPSSDNGPDGWVHVHHSLDGRELHERSSDRL
jgi:hypothetical protein